MDRDRKDTGASVPSNRAAAHLEGGLLARRGRLGASRDDGGIDRSRRSRRRRAVRDANAGKRGRAHRGRFVGRCDGGTGRRPRGGARGGGVGWGRGRWGGGGGGVGGGGGGGGWGGGGGGGGGRGGSGLVVGGFDGCSERVSLTEWTSMRRRSNYNRGMTFSCIACTWRWRRTFGIP